MENLKLSNLNLHEKVTVKIYRVSSDGSMVAVESDMQTLDPHGLSRGVTLDKVYNVSCEGAIPFAASIDLNFTSMKVSNGSRIFTATDVDDLVSWLNSQETFNVKAVNLPILAP